MEQLNLIYLNTPLVKLEENWGAEKLAIRAIAKASGHSEKEIEEDLKKPEILEKKVNEIAIPTLSGSF